MKTPLFAVVTLLLVIPFVIADYNIHLEGGNGPLNTYSILGTGTETFTTIDPPSASFGTRRETIIGDMDNDGSNEIWVYSGNNIMSVLDGDNPENEKSAISVGEPDINPALCDVDNDGTMEYVGVFNNGTYNLHMIEYSSGGATSGAHKVLANQTNIYGKIVCDKFYSPEGDNKYYAIFTDANRFLHIAYVSGGVWIDQMLDVEGAVATEAADGTPWSEKNDPIVMDEFVPGGEKIILFLAGDNLIGYESDGDTHDKDIGGEIGSTTTVTLLGQPHNGNDRVIVGTGRGSGNTDTFSKYRMVWPGILVQDGSEVNINDGATGTKTAWAVGDWNGDSTHDIFYSYRTLGGNYNFRVYYGGNFSTIATFSGGNHCNAGEHRRVYAVDMDNDGDKDAFTSCGNDSTEVFFYMENLNNNTIQNVLFRDNVYTDTAPVPVDYNRDGYLDLVYSETTQTRFYQSSTTTTTQQNYPFSAVLNHTTTDLESVVTITAEYENTGATYNYAVVCDDSSTPIWFENFGLSYNFTTQNVSLNVHPPEDLLVFGGIETTIGGNTTQFDMLKEYHEGVRDDMKFTFDFVEASNRTWDVLAFSEDNLITWYYRINKTGTNVSVEKIVPFQGETHVGDVVISTSTVEAEIVHTPVLDSFTGQRYYEIEWKINNNTISNSSESTAQFTGDDVRNVEVFTDTPGELYISSFGLLYQHDLTPTFTQFQNGVRTVTSGVIIEVASPQGTSIEGEDYTVIPDYNETFYGLCEYEAAGTYTQRHYIGPNNDATDYTNYEELTVTVSEEATSGFIDSGDAILADDEVVSVIDEWLESIGMGSTFGKFIFWSIIVIIIGLITFPTNTVLGVISVLIAIVAGALIGFYPFWFVIILVILSVSALAIGFRKVFVGD